MVRVIQYNSDFQASGFWRMLWPQMLLNMKGKAEIMHGAFSTRDYLQYRGIDCVHLQRQINPDQVAFMKKLRQMKGNMQCRIVYDADDILFHEDIPSFHPLHKTVAAPEIREAIQNIIEMCDEMTVSTTFLRDYYLEKTSQKNITVIPNSIPLFYLGEYYSEALLLRNYRRNKDRPRILYAGGVGHVHLDQEREPIHDDFTHVKEAIRDSVQEFKWVFLGNVPRDLLDLVYSGEIEVHPYQPIDMYPRAISMLGISMAIAPLADLDFNRAKSDLKYLEASAFGIPIACQDMCAYKMAPIRFKTGHQMIEKMENTLETEDSFLEASRNARRAVDLRWLERPENYNKYLDVYSYPYGDSRRKYLNQSRFELLSV